MSSYTNENKLLNLIPEATLIAIFTACSYWIAFVYEVGYFKTFDIPYNLIQLKLESVLTVFVLLIGVLWLVFLIGNFLAMFWPTHPALKVKAVRVSLIILLLLIHIINYGFRRTDWIIYIFFGVVLIIFELIWPILVHSKKKNFSEKIIADEVAEEPARSKSIFGRIFNLIGPAGYNLLLFIFVSSWLAYTQGVAKAETTKEYYVVQDTNLVVVKMYPEVIYCVPFNPESKALLPKLIILSSYDKGTIELEMKKIGPLKVEKEQ
ncbi:MAG: hypothetical protein RIG61_01460 [Deltaproteobacteria bacterium]